MEPGIDSHPVTRAVAAAEQALVSVETQPVWSLGSRATREALVALSRLASRAAELESRLLVHADTTGAYDDLGATSSAAGLAHTTRTTRAEALGKTRLAGQLEVHGATREALARGEIRADQAAVICAAVDDLSEEDVAGEADLRERGEKHLLAAAEHHDARALRILGRRLLEVADPARADEHENARLEREERAALRAARVTFADQGDGTTRARVTLPTAQASMLKKYLHAFAAPKHRRATGGAGAYDHSTPLPDRMGRALCELIERYPRKRLPRSGGVSATVIVTMGVETLRGGLAAASLDTGVRISAGQARRLACEAGIIPVVLGGESQVLDVGRERRLHTKAMRVARLTQLTAGSPTDTPACEHPTCDVPAAWCHAHHERWWSRGGDTSLSNLRLLCPRHHALAHAGHDATPRRT